METWKIINFLCGDQRFIEDETKLYTIHDSSTTLITIHKIGGPFNASSPIQIGGIHCRQTPMHCIYLIIHVIGSAYNASRPITNEEKRDKLIPKGNELISTYEITGK